jgi:hypothetical protein
MNSVRHGGGKVPALRALVTRVYPMQFMSVITRSVASSDAAKSSSGKIVRNQKAEEAAQLRLNFAQQSSDAFADGGSRVSHSVTNTEDNQRDVSPFFQVVFVICYIQM